MKIEQTLEMVARSYPQHMIATQLTDIKRTAYNIQLAVDGADPRSLSICDIGGGVGLFSPGCAALGIHVVLIDDLADPVNVKEGNAPLLVHRKFGVKVLCRDVIAQGVADIGERFDIVTSFDSMEHWHHSPKALFHEVRDSLLKPGGRFVLGVPNCVNLRKRITVPLGIGKWSSMLEWYEETSFRGHVREPDVSDLRYIANDMGLKDARIVGRNWLGYQSRFDFVRAGMWLADIPLRFFPSLCSDIYLTGTVDGS